MKQFNIVYVQSNDAINAHQHVRQNDQYVFTYYFDTLNDFYFYENIDCCNAFFIDAFDSSLSLQDLQNFINNHYADEFCRCNHNQCKTTFYFHSDLSLEQQRKKTIQYVNRVIVENESGSFDEHFNVTEKIA
ncbi:MAG: hypothetical protein FWE08_01260 [Oscillospiraceae bacterium]|nr:hypothetical protein [Oscillospiraceae bacterium]